MRPPKQTIALLKRAFVTEFNIKTVAAVIEQDRPLSARKLVSLLNMFKMQVTRILTRELKMKRLRLCSACVPHLLTREQMGTRLRIAQEDLLKIQDSAYLERVVTVAESWIHHYNPPPLKRGCENRNQSVKKLGSRNPRGRSNWWHFSIVGEWLTSIFSLRRRELMENILW